MNLPPLSALELRHQFIRNPTDHKGQGGRVVVIGGANGMLGAVVLAGIAALYCGAGWVDLRFLAQPRPLLIPEHPELMVSDAADLIKQQTPSNLESSVIAIGPGMGHGQLALDLLYKVIQTDTPIVLDADALNLLSENELLIEALRTRKSPTVLTPHPGEAARLLKISTEKVQQNRNQALAQLVELTHSVVVLKGHGTLCGAPNQVAEICHAGNSGMGSGGMGDTLTGIIAALVSQGRFRGVSAWDATRLGVALHANAADNLVKGNVLGENSIEPVGPIGLTASEVVLEVRKILNAK